MKKALIIRHCAFGDAIHASHLPHLLHDQGYEVYLNTNYKGSQIFAKNPYIKSMTVEDITIYPRWLVPLHWDLISEGFDKVVNLYNSIEHGLLAMEHENSYYMSNKVRRQRWEGINYYDQMTIEAGYPDLCGKYKGEMWFDDLETNTVKNWINSPLFRGKFLVMLNLAGTGPHKRFIQAQEVANELLKDPDVHIIITGGKECEAIDFTKDLNGRATSIVGRFPFRQAALVTRYLNCVIGCESGIMCASAMWNTPTIQLMTATSIVAHNKYNKNDFSLQSPCKCSPCHKGPYQYFGCPSKDGNPLCVYFDVKDIVSQYKKIRNPNKEAKTEVLSESTV